MVGFQEGGTPNDYNKSLEAHEMLHAHFEWPLSTWTFAHNPVILPNKCYRAAPLFLNNENFPEHVVGYPTPPPQLNSF